MAKQLRKKIDFSKKGGHIIKEEGENQPVKKIFCSKGCDTVFNEKLMRKVSEENESQLFMGDFAVVKQAAAIL